MKISFRVKLFSFCVVIILFTSVPIAITIGNYVINSLKDDLLSNSARQIEELDNSILNLISQTKENVKILAENKDVKKTDESIPAKFDINNFKADNKDSGKIQELESEIYNNFELYGTTHDETQYVRLGTKWGGYIQWPDVAKNDSYDPRNRPWYSLALEHPDEVTISHPHEVEMDKSENKTISTCTTVRNDSGDIVGVIAVDMSLNKLSNIIGNIKSVDNGYYFLYLKDGTILANSNSELNFKNINDLEAGNSEINSASNFEISDTSKFINTENGSFDALLNGKDVFVNVYTSPYTGWKLATIIPKAEFMTKVRNIENIIIGITICILILGIVLTYFVIRTITAPIKELTSLMKTAGEGELSVRANIGTNDEFGTLGDSFNLMMGRLSSNYEELSALYEELVATEEELRTQYEELQYNEEALKNSEERYKLALECANDSIWELNLETGEFFCSDKLLDIIGDKWKLYKNAKDFSRNLIHPDDLGRVRKELNRHINNETKAIEIEYRLKNSSGYYVWVLCKGKAVKNSEDRILKVAGAISDISERKLTEEKLEFMAYYDALTRLPNKTKFIEILNEQLGISKEETAGAAFRIDLDDFKNINDLMGYKYGDKLLIYLAEHLKEIIDEREILCKFSGDEFMILSPLTKKSEIKAYADRILSFFNQSFNINNTQISITASIGVALYPKDGTDSDTIIKKAGLAMYKAKELGKNRYALYNYEIYLKLERISKIKSILRDAIENGEFSVDYQPQYDTLNNEVFGFEALVRLNSRELGIISPAEFITVAEKYGYITKITLWVFKEACRRAVKLLEDGYNFRSMSINISSVDLQQADFLEKVAEIIKETGIETRFIELEITETVLMKSIDSSIDILKKFMNMGIRIALDDFGTGYSSLAYLRKIPISTLKIDKSFIDDIDSSNVEKSIINNIIEMAHAMDLKVVAEGVENREQFLILKDRNCDYIQGYYFSKPLPANKIEEIFT